MTNSTSFRSAKVAGALAATFALLASALARPAMTQAHPEQDFFVNYEVGPVSPLALATLQFGSATRTVLLACNTSNNALEVYDTPSLVRIKSIPTGLAPVTVRWDPTSGRAYVCNFIGDSITRVDVTATGKTGSTVQLDIRLKATVRVGDEPNDIVVVPGTNEAIISLRSRSAVARFDTASMTLLEARRVLTDEATTAPILGAKNPGSMTMVGNDRLYVLDRQSDAEGPDDLDLLEFDSQGTGLNPLTATGRTVKKFGGLGTTHHDFATNQAGDRLYVVGMQARPGDASFEDLVGDLATGFVQSWLWVVDPAAAVPVRLESTGSGGTQPSINLNRNYQIPTPLTGIAATEALAQPTSVALFEENNVVTKVVLTAFSSDKVAMLRPSATHVSGWDTTWIAVPKLSGYSMAGPRDVVIDPGSEIAYVLCSLDSSVRSFDISGTQPQTLVTQALEFDPTPARIRDGREFLYGAANHSLNGAVSCSSCHIDGHTDSIVWTLNQPDQGVPPPGLINGPSVPPSWTANKGPMVTQTLRGLVNFDVDGPGQRLFTNAPYHWRADRENFEAFNGAFVELMDRPLGLLDGPQIASFTNFIETILHPPNPEQPLLRDIPGATGSNGYEPTDGTGMFRGLKLFHANNQAGLSCAHCHVPPDGSGNRLTQFFEVGNDLHPIEPAALRHLFDREAALITDSGPVPTTPNQVWVQNTGLFHDGDTSFPSISHFVQNRFLVTMPGVYDFSVPTSQAQIDAAKAQLLDLTAFVRAFDSGSAPIIGFVYNCGSSATTNRRAFGIFKSQVDQANAGLVARTDLNGTERSYWYEPVSGRFQNDASQTSLSFNALLSQAGGSNVIILEAVPVGAAQKLADVTHANVNDVGPGPTQLTLEDMTMPTHWARAGDLRGFWELANPAFVYPAPFRVAPRESHKRQLYMQGQLILADGNGFPTGVTVAKNEPPRRFRVSGDNIRYGATLTLHMAGPGSTEIDVEMPLYRTKFTSGGHPVWETAVEADGEMTLAFLCGGYFRLNVGSLIDFATTTYPAMNPATDNDYGFTVKNLNGSFLTVASGAVLRVSNVR